MAPRTPVRAGDTYPAHPGSEDLASGVGDVGIPCALNAHGALYAGWDLWLPAGWSAFCRGETYPSVPGPAEVASQLVRAGRLLATITFDAASDTYVDLYCYTRPRAAGIRRAVPLTTGGSRSP